MSRTVIAALIAGIFAGVGAGYFAGSMRARHAEPTVATHAAPQGERKILYWYDPMAPQSRFDKPGKSPFMDMQLVPKYADEATGDGGVTISPRVTQSLGVRTAEARVGSLTRSLSAVGNVEYNERAVVVVQPRANGFVEKLHARAPLDAVRTGDPLVEILFPDWAAAQEEYLLLRRTSTPDSDSLQRAARQRLVLLGMDEELIAAIERDGKPRTRITLRAPVSGVIAELGVREGMTVAAGTMLFRIAGLGTVWVIAQVPEAQADILSPGAKVEVRVPAYPGEAFSGRLGAILPEVNTQTRTVRARIEVANPGGKLKPGMYAQLAFTGRERKGLLVPGEAVIRTGERSVVIVALPDGLFRAVDVETGTDAGDSAEIRKGLKPGDRVVISGQFLIDSEASLRTALARLSASGESTGNHHAGRTSIGGTGTVIELDAAKSSVRLEHGPIPALEWPAMTMDFAVADKSQLAHLKKGDRVEFDLRGKQAPDGGYVIERIAPTGK